MGTTTHKFSVNKLATVTGYSRPAIQRRFDLFGPHPKKILLLAPLKDEPAEDVVSLEQARTQLAIEDAGLKRIQREKLEGKLADVDEVIERVTDLANDIEAIIRTSPLDDDRKADIYSAIRQAAKDWSA